MSVISGLVLIFFGFWMIISPKSALDFKISIAKTFGAKLTVSKKTVNAYRWTGVVVLAVGLIILF